MALIPLLGNCQIAVPSWVDGIGGVGSSSIPADVRTDQQNNVYITGLYSGTVDFDPSPAGVFNLTSVNGSFDIYVAKYTSAGKFIWAVSMGGTGTDQVNAMTIDANGNPTISGQYDSPVLDADPGPGVHNLINNGDKDAFIIVLTTNGAFSWAKSTGGSQTDYGGKVVADSQGNVVQVIQFQATVTVGNNTYTSQGAFNDLIVKYNSAGNLIWSIDIGDTNNSEPHSCAIDHNDNVIVSGSFSSNDNFNPLGTASFLNGNGISTFIAKYTSAGNLIWVTSIAGSLVNSNSNLCVNSKNEIYVDGPFSSTLVFNGVKTLNPVGIQDLFVAKLSSNGVFQTVNAIGGVNASMYNYGLVADQVDNIYLSGYFSGTVDFNPSPTATAFVSDDGQRDMFLSKFDQNLNYKWAFSGGNASCNNTLARNVTVDNNNDVLLTGSFCSTVNFDASKCTSYNLTAQSNIRDSFLAKYVQSKATANSQITAFSVFQQVSPAIIDQTNLQITITVPTGTDIFALKPVIAFSTGATVVPASGIAQNFTSPVTYTVNTSCNTLNYTVNVVFLNTAKPVTTCSGASNIIVGDVENPVPTSYTWQLLQNNVWVNAPGVINNKDYQTSSLINNTNANVIFSLRRQILIAGNVSSDSFYTVTMQPVIAILNNLVTPPAVTSFCSSGIPGTIVGSIPTGGNGTYTYQWQSSANNVTFTDVAGATAKDISPVLVNATIYFRRTVTSGNCVAPLVGNVVTITVIPAVTNNTVTAPAVTAFCSAGDPAIIVGSVPLRGNGTYTYQWQSSVDNVTFTNIAGAVSKDFNPPLINITTYYRRTIISGVCITPVVSNVIPINVIAIPAVPVPVASVVSVCTGNTATLSVATPLQGITYDWYDTATKTNHLFTGITYVTGPLNTGKTYYVGATNGTCTSLSLAAVQVNVNGIPAKPLVGNPISICSGSVATLSISNPQAALTYNWYAAATGGSVAFTGINFVTLALAANITYYAETANSNGCVSATRTAVNVTVNTLPQIVTQGIAICPGTSTTLTASSTDLNAAINWYTAATGGNKLSTGNTFTTPALNANTSYYAEAVDNISGCVSAARSQAQVQMIQPLATLVVTVSTATVSSVTFQWDAVSGATGYQISIDNGLTFTDPSSGSSGLTHTVSGLQLLQSVTIIVRASGSSSCQLSNNSIAVTGTALSPLGDQIFVPNAFTPNGDGKNDVVNVHAPNIKSLKFYVYDQWGELLFTSVSQQNGWDGTYKGTVEPVGVYVYYLEAIMNDGQKVNKKGTITLLR